MEPIVWFIATKYIKELLYIYVILECMNWLLNILFDSHKGLSQRTVYDSERRIPPLDLFAKKCKHSNHYTNFKTLALSRNTSSVIYLVVIY